VRMVNQECQNAEGTRRQIGYFCYLAIEKKHLGGVLVTSQIGVPMEFKYTEPVATTKLHKILYGASLEKYLHETVIRDRLSREIRSVPEYFVTSYDEREFLGQMAGKEMMALQLFPSTQKDSTGPFTRVRDKEAIVELEDGPLLRVAFSTVDDAVQRSMAIWLQEIARTMDVMEPLDRVVNALNSLYRDERKN
jgi:hypothetical protein